MPKPKRCCIPDCFSCPYKDCRYSDVEYSDILSQDEFDKNLFPCDLSVLNRRKRQSKYSKTEKGKISHHKYQISDKGKASQDAYKKTKRYKITQQRYEKTDNAKERQKKYRTSDKGKISEKKKSAKKIKSGKNAEYCRRYYQRKKLERNTNNESCGKKASESS